MSENGSDFGAFMAGFVIGGLVSAATALILAPQSGAETRAQIAAKGDDLWQTGEQQFHDTSSQVQERARIILDEGKSKVNVAIHKDQSQIVESNLEDEQSPAADQEETTSDLTD